MTLAFVDWAIRDVAVIVAVGKPKNGTKTEFFSPKSWSGPYQIIEPSRRILMTPRIFLRSTIDSKFLVLPLFMIVLMSKFLFLLYITWNGIFLLSAAPQRSREQRWFPTNKTPLPLFLASTSNSNPSNSTSDSKSLWGKAHASKVSNIAVPLDLKFLMIFFFDFFIW